MSDMEIKEIPDAVKKKLTHLLNSKPAHLELGKKIIQADNGHLYEEDFIIFAVINRSLALIDGFSSMVNSKNVLCANALLRLQIDNILRTNAWNLVACQKEFFSALLKGERLHQLTSKDGKKLTDNYLCNKASENFPWIKNVYEKTSGFIHLSSPHFYSTITSINNEKRSYQFTIGGNNWSEKDMVESVEAFTEATKNLLELICGWLATKENIKHNLCNGSVRKDPSGAGDQGDGQPD